MRDRRLMTGDRVGETRDSFFISIPPLLGGWMFRESEREDTAEFICCFTSVDDGRGGKGRV